MSHIDAYNKKLNKWGVNVILYGIMQWYFGKCDILQPRRLIRLVNILNENSEMRRHIDALPLYGKIRKAWQARYFFMGVYVLMFHILYIVKHILARQHIFSF